MVADDRALAARLPQHGTYRFWNYRVVQWLVFLVFCWSLYWCWLASKAQEVQALAELTVVKSTVGAAHRLVLEQACQQTDRAAAIQPACENRLIAWTRLPLQYVGALRWSELTP